MTCTTELIHLYFTFQSVIDTSCKYIYCPSVIRCFTFLQMRESLSTKVLYTINDVILFADFCMRLNNSFAIRVRAPQLFLWLLFLSDSVGKLRAEHVFPTCLTPSVSVHRATSWNRKVILSPRVAPCGSWTPRNPNALSALSTRPPYSEWTPPPDLLCLASPFFLPPSLPPSILLCAFSL